MRPRLRSRWLGVPNDSRALSTLANDPLLPRCGTLSQDIKAAIRLPRRICTQSSALAARKRIRSAADILNGGPESIKGLFINSL
jgi:hypothetical protein